MILVIVDKSDFHNNINLVGDLKNTAIFSYHHQFYQHNLWSKDIYALMYSKDGKSLILCLRMRHHMKYWQLDPWENCLPWLREYWVTIILFTNHFFFMLMVSHFHPIYYLLKDATVFFWPTSSDLFTSHILI